MINDSCYNSKATSCTRASFSYAYSQSARAVAIAVSSGVRLKRDNSPSRLSQSTLKYMPHVANVLALSGCIVYVTGKRPR